MNNLYWHSLGYLRKREDAEKYELLYNTKVVVYPTKIIEHEFKNIKEIEEELNEN